MSLIPTIYSSSDPGAPQLSGTVGALISVLRAILVTGYGDAPTAKAGLGWTEEYSASNKVVFRNNPVSGTGRYVRVLDDGSVVGGTRAAQLLVFESMSDVDTGIGRTPSAAAQPSGSLWIKSKSADAVTRAWWAIGNERALYLFTGWNFGNVGSAVPYFVGDIISDKPGDSYGFAIIGAPELSSFSGGNTELSSSCFFIHGYDESPALGSQGSGGYLLRAADAISESKRAFNAWPSLASTLPDTCYGHAAGAFPVYPDPVTSGYRYCECLLAESGGARAIRGRLPGVYGLMHQAPFADLEVVPAAPEMPPGASCIAKSFWTGKYTAPFINGQVLFTVNAEWA